MGRLKAEFSCLFRHFNQHDNKRRGRGAARLKPRRSGEILSIGKNHTTGVKAKEGKGK